MPFYARTHIRAQPSAAGVIRRHAFKQVSQLGLVGHDELFVRAGTSCMQHEAKTSKNGINGISQRLGPQSRFTRGLRPLSIKRKNPR